MDSELKKLLTDVLNSNIETQNMVHQEIGGMRKNIEEINNRVESLSSTLKEYNDMKLQAKGIIGLIRLFWNIGLIGIVIAIAKKKFNIEF